MGQTAHQGNILIILQDIIALIAVCLDIPMVAIQEIEDSEIYLNDFRYLRAET
jgi:hypothetical protein